MQESESHHHRHRQRICCCWCSQSFILFSQSWPRLFFPLTAQMITSVRENVILSRLFNRVDLLCKEPNPSFLPDTLFSFFDRLNWLFSPSTHRESRFRSAFGVCSFSSSFALLFQKGFTGSKLQQLQLFSCLSTSLGLSFLHDLVFVWKDRSQERSCDHSVMQMR
jgi:hypothetical protein